MTDVKQLKAEVKRTRELKQLLLMVSAKLAKRAKQ